MEKMRRDFFYIFIINILCCTTFDAYKAKLSGFLNFIDIKLLIYFIKLNLQKIY